MLFTRPTLAASCAFAVTLLASGAAQAALNQAQATLQFEFIFSGNASVLDPSVGQTFLTASFYGTIDPYTSGPTFPQSQTLPILSAGSVSVSHDGNGATASSTPQARGASLSSSISGSFDPAVLAGGPRQGTTGGGSMEGQFLLAPGESVDIVSTYSLSGSRASDNSYTRASVAGFFDAVGLGSSGPNQNFQRLGTASLYTSPDPTFSESGSFTATFSNTGAFAQTINYLFSEGTSGGIGDPAAPVPEPQTWLMLGLGLAAIGGWTKRSRKRAVAQPGCA